MTNKQRGVLVFSIFMIATMLVSACTQSLSQAPATTATPIPTGLFVSPFPSVENPMAMIEEFAKQTAAAQTAAAGGSPATTNTPDPAAAAVTGTPSVDVATATATVANSTPTNVGAASVTPGLAAATSVPVGSRPPTYTLQAGEFPYCIARRYDVNPDELLSASGLTAGQANSLATGTKLTIPQTGSFPGSRALAPHPATYTVASGDETIYSVACKFGDVEPNDIAAKNGISVSASLTAGQQLQIP